MSCVFVCSINRQQINHLHGIRCIKLLERREGINNLLSRTKEEVHNIVYRTGSITLANLECAIDTSFNLLFLAIEKLISENKIKIRRGKGDYIISIHDNLKEKNKHE